jgi:nucleoside-diphosphate-sugar epimerase
MKIVVTGAAGFIGSHVAERLKNRGADVVGIDAFTDYYEVSIKERNAALLSEKGIPVVRADLAEDGDQDKVRSAVQDASFVIHLAAQPGISDSTPFHHYVRNNIVATEQLVLACQQVTQLRLFLNVATSSVYGFHATDPEDAAPRPASSYGVTKLAAENLVMARWYREGFPASSFRLFSVYGPRERPDKVFPILARALLNDTEFPLFAGSEEHRRSFTFVSDIVDGIEAAVADPERIVGEICNIGSDTSITTGEAIRIMEEIVGRPARIKRLPPRSGDQRETRATIDKIRRLLGYQPKVLPQEGLARYVDWARGSR